MDLNKETQQQLLSGWLYTARFFFNGLSGGKSKPYQEITLEAFCPTEAMNRAREEAQRIGADHFNVHRGLPDHEEETVTAISRKR